MILRIYYTHSNTSHALTGAGVILRNELVYVLCIQGDNIL